MAWKRPQKTFDVTMLQTDDRDADWPLGLRRQSQR
jgi:hypothetical protein